MVAGAAGNNLYVAHFGEQFCRLWTESLDHNVVLAQAPFQGALDDSRLLVDFLEHEVAIRALISSLGAFVVLHGLALHLFTGQIPDGYLVTANLGDVAFFQVHETVSDLTQGQLIRSQEVLAVTQANDQRAATASS
ncbi:hypothetical protein D3C77_543190 [compost metagenome]